MLRNTTNSLGAFCTASPDQLQGTSYPEALGGKWGKDRREAGPVPEGTATVRLRGTGPGCSELHVSPRGTEHLNGIGSQRIHQVAALLRSAGTEPAVRESDHQRATWDDRLHQTAGCLATVTQQAPVSTLLKASQVISGKTEAVAQGVASGILELPLF